jgi:hypothetical protein
MSYRIRHLKDLRITPRPYFLDANVWLYFMQGEFLSHDPYGVVPYQKTYHHRYHTLVTRLFEADGARIALPALIVSEVVNAFMKKFMMPTNLRMLGSSDREVMGASLKHHYRDNKESNYSEAMSFLVTQFLSFYEADKIEACDMNFKNKTNAYDVLSNFSKMNNTDFNDYCYYELCADRQWPMITDDSDFCFPVIEIYTYNEKMLRRAGVKC